MNSLYQGGRGRRGRRAGEGGGRRALQQRADRRRPVAAPAHAGADRPPRHAARGRRRHARALPALRRRREDRAEAQGADHRHRAGHRRRGAAGAGGAQAARRRRRPRRTPWSGPTRPTMRWSSPRRRRSCARSWTSSTSSTSAARRCWSRRSSPRSTTDKNAELGVNWAAFSNGTNIPAGALRQPGRRHQHRRPRRRHPEPGQCHDHASLQGTTLGIGRIAGTGVNFAAMLRAIRGDTDTNVIATPSTVTMDNQEAELKVAQEVPFVTGQFTNTGARSTAARSTRSRPSSARRSAPSSR